MKHPLPSPTGRNAERLFIDAPWFNRNPRAAYDSARGLEQPESSKAARVARMITDCLSRDELADLGREVVTARDAKYGSAKDEEPSHDPNATRAGVNATLERKRDLNAGGSAMDSRRRARIAQDKKFASVLKSAFARPGTKTYDRLERRKLAADAAVTKSLEARYPDLAKIGVEAAFTDPKAGPHSMANDGRLVRSLEERYPDLKKIGFA
jgi:hypothetical protein